MERVAVHEEERIVRTMTKEQISILEHAAKGLGKSCWWECNGCPIRDKCEEEDPNGENYNPPCEKALFEAIETVKRSQRLTMTVAELQEALGISYVTASNLTLQKDFPSFRIGRRILINREGLGKWMKEQEAKK